MVVEDDVRFLDDVKVENADIIIRHSTVEFQGDVILNQASLEASGDVIVEGTVLVQAYSSTTLILRQLGHVSWFDNPHQWHVFQYYWMR